MPLYKILRKHNNPMNHSKAEYENRNKVELNHIQGLTPIRHQRQKA